MMQEKDEQRAKSDSRPADTKPMDKKDVANSPDEKTDQDFPGYPHYPAREDIMDQRTDSHRVDVDVENLPNKNNLTGVGQRFEKDQAGKMRNATTPQPGLGDDDLEIRPGTEADVDEDDLAALNATNGEIGVPQNVDNEDLNSDLDVPGSDLDDMAEEVGGEDEENNYYSLGGDRHEAQEENPESDPVRGE